eukprot:12947180-Ditylum_brightwellii.AAC.1
MVWRDTSLEEGDPANADADFSQYMLTILATSLIGLRRQIVQSSDLKEKLEQCVLKRNEVTLMSLDIKLIQKALNYYARDLPDAAKETIDLCMDIVQFGTKSTLI